MYIRTRIRTSVEGTNQYLDYRCPEIIDAPLYTKNIGVSNVKYNVSTVSVKSAIINVLRNLVIVDTYVRGSSLVSRSNNFAFCKTAEN